MSTGAEDVRRLRDKWFSSDPNLTDPVHAVLDAIGFSSTYVENCLRSSAAATAPKKEKVIKDSVWGMVEVDSASARLLDSPIIQRLRNVKQLGFTFFTYPSAEHSRFIHTLGMYAVVRRFIESMRRRHQEPVSDYRRHPVDEELERDLLHAAILHDCGHMPFSHATEKACRAYEKEFRSGPFTVRDFVFEATDLLGRNVHLSECLSLAIVLSPRFAEYYNGYVRHTEDQHAISRVGALIAGLAPGPKLTGPAQLISSSSVDADKVDYINRDAFECGIPVGIDVARLFLRSGFVDVPGKDLKKLYSKKEEPPDEIVFVVNASGMDTIEELAHARASLYQRVYLHQTTRNAERLLERCLEALPKKRLQDEEHLRDALYLLSVDDSSLLRQLATHPDVAELGTRLRNRDLPKRACVFSRTLTDMVMNPKDVFDAMPQDKANALIRQTLGKSLQALLSPTKPSSPLGLTGEKLTLFEKQIVGEAKRIAELVKKSRPKLVPEDEVEPSLVTVLAMTELQDSTRIASCWKTTDSSTPQLEASQMSKAMLRIFINHLAMS